MWRFTSPEGQLFYIDREHGDTALSAFVKRFKEDGVTNHNVKNHFGGSSSSNLLKSSSSSRTVRGWTSFEKTVWLRRATADAAPRRSLRGRARPEALEAVSASEGPPWKLKLAASAQEIYIPVI